jgi:hypothetical protein
LESHGCIFEFLKRSLTKNSNRDPQCQWGATIAYTFTWVSPDDIVASQDEPPAAKESGERILGAVKWPEEAFGPGAVFGSFFAALPDVFAHREMRGTGFCCPETQASVELMSLPCNTSVPFPSKPCL